jgi:hypothetical protein
MVVVLAAAVKMVVSVIGTVLNLLRNSLLVLVTF